MSKLRSAPLADRTDKLVIVATLKTAAHSYLKSRPSEISCARRSTQHVPPIVMSTNMLTQPPPFHLKRWGWKRVITGPHGPRSGGRHQEFAMDLLIRRIKSR